MSDSVNNPAHYQHAGIQTVDYILAVLGEQGFHAYCMGNVIKYVSRYRLKGGIEDLRKAEVYLAWATDNYPGEEVAEPVTLAEILEESQQEEPPLRAGGTD